MREIRREETVDDLLTLDHHGEIETFFRAMATPELTLAEIHDEDLAFLKGKIARKPNDIMGLKIHSGHVTLLSRKLLNVLVYHAQRQKEPGNRVPTNEPLHKEYYWVPMADVMKDMAFRSNASQVIQEALQAIQKTLIEKNSNTRWSSSSLLSSVIILKDEEGEFAQKGTIWFGFNFPPDIREMIQSPERYTKLSLYYQARFRSATALALYEMCVKDAFRKRTSELMVEEWYWILTGNEKSVAQEKAKKLQAETFKTESGVEVLDAPKQSDLMGIKSAPLLKIPEYRYFKRDVLTLAIEEINALSDLNVQLVEHKSGRKIVKLHFAIKYKSQKSLAFPPPPIDANLLEALLKLGMSEKIAADLCASHHEEEDIWTVVHSIETRSNQTPIKNWVAYFSKSLEQIEEERRREAEERRKQRPAFVDARSLKDQFRDARMVEPILYYEALPLDDKNTTNQRDLKVKFQFERPQFAHLVDENSRGFKDDEVKKAFHLWYANRYYAERGIEVNLEDPSDDELNQWLEEKERRLQQQMNLIT